MKRKRYLQLTCPGPIPVSRHMPLVLQTRRCCHCKENELQCDNAIGISIKNDYKNNCSLKCIFPNHSGIYCAIFLRLVHIQESFSNSKGDSYSIAGHGVGDLWPFISTKRKLFQNQCCLSLERSFDLETSKAPMVLDGGKPKGGGHLTLIYLTFISTKIRHVLASLSDIQQQHRCLAMHCNAASSFTPEFPSSTGTQLRHYSLIITESLQVSMLVAFLPKLATELNCLPTEYLSVMR